MFPDLEVVMVLVVMVCVVIFPVFMAFIHKVVRVSVVMVFCVCRYTRSVSSYGVLCMSLYT